MSDQQPPSPEHPAGGGPRPAEPRAPEPSSEPAAPQTPSGEPPPSPPPSGGPASPPPPSGEPPPSSPPPWPQQPADEEPRPAEAGTSPPGGPSHLAAHEPATGRAPLCSNGKRFGAYLLEVLLVFLTLVIGWWVWAVIVWRDGQTPAKSLLKMRCVKADTRETATWGTMALRELVGKFILGTVTSGITTIISAFLILFDDQRQGLWDKIASTVVVDEAAARRSPSDVG